jgi:thymidine kinase
MTNNSGSTYTGGTVQVFAGGMYCGKTTELILRADKIGHRPDKNEEKDMIFFKADIDTRDKYIQSRAMTKRYPYTAVLHNEPGRMLELSEGIEIVGIDDAQFFSNGLARTIREMKRRKQFIMVAALDTTFRGEAYNEMGEVLADADFREKLTATCVTCGHPATRTQRLMLGNPAPYDSLTDIVQGSTLAKLLAVDYEARCASCHEVPTTPTFSQVLNDLVTRLGLTEEQFDAIKKRS